MRRFGVTLLAAFAGGFLLDLFLVIINILIRTLSPASVYLEIFVFGSVVSLIAMLIRGWMFSWDEGFREQLRTGLVAAIVAGALIFIFGLAQNAGFSESMIVAFLGSIVFFPIGLVAHMAQDWLSSRFI